MFNVRFPTSLNEARKFQQIVSQQISLKDEFGDINYITGLDISYKNKRAYGAAIVYDCKNKKVIEKKGVEMLPKFEYVSGLLFMREVPIFLRLVEQLENQPDLFLIDGHGIAHPLYAGSATVFGYFIKTPVIGVAKAPMNVFEFGSEEKREDFLITNLYVGKRLVGKKIAYKDKNWKPIYVSPGNNISISSSLDVVINLLDSKHKLPKPLLLAHLAANEYKENIYH